VGHVWRMPDHRIFHRKPSWRISRGRLRERRMDCVEGNLQRV